MADQPATGSAAPTTTASAPPVQGTPTTAPQTITAPPVEQVEGTTTAQSAPAAPEPLDPNYIARGGRWKLTEDQLRAVPQSVLEQMMAAADGEVLENMHRARQGLAPIQPQGPHGQQAPQSQPDSLPFKPVELKFDEADEDSPVVAHVKAINEGVTRNLNDFHQWLAPQLQEIANALQGLRELNDYGILDRHLSQLGDDWKDVFGDGATIDLDPRSPHYAARDNYRKAILENLELDASLGRDRDRNEAMLRARYRLHGQKIASLERAKREAKAKAAAASLPAPTGAPNGRAPAMGLRESVMRAFAH